MVNFEADETCNRNFGDSSTGHYDKYRKIGREGILLGLRRYRFFGESFHCTNVCSVISLFTVNNCEIF